MCIVAIDSVCKEAFSKGSSLIRPFAFQNLALFVQKLAALDLYCGCGGMSFLDHGGQVKLNDEQQGVQIETCWAVDSVEAMSQSFRVNYPNTKVIHCNHNPH